jgi:hypothetical protein
LVMSQNLSAAAPCKPQPVIQKNIVIF